MLLRMKETAPLFLSEACFSSVFLADSSAFCGRDGSHCFAGILGSFFSLTNKFLWKTKLYYGKGLKRYFLLWHVGMFDTLDPVET